MKDNNILVTELRTQLRKDDLYSTKDELLLAMLGNAYELYCTSGQDCETNGTVISYTTATGAQVDKVSPSYTIMLEQSKEIFKYLTALYLTPASRKMLELSKANKSINPFDALTTAMAKMAAEDDEDDEKDEVETDTEGDSDDNRPY